jgi:hypothetical protein
VFVIEPSDAVNAGMARKADERQLALLCKSLPSVSSLVGWCVGLLVGWLVGWFLPLLKKLLFFPNRINKFMKFKAKYPTPCFNQFCWDLINNW